MSQKIIAVVGVSGVGKSTFLKKLQSKVGFQHLQASDVIRQQIQHKENQHLNAEVLRHANIDENQRFLISGFDRLRDPNALIVILDGHTVIDSPSGLVDIDAIVFKSMGVTHLVCLVEDPCEILRRRTSDIARARPDRSLSYLEKYQFHAQSVGFKISLSLGIPFTVLSSGCLEWVEHIIKEY